MSSVDVVVPCYRYGRFLRECVESILAQQDIDLRILIIDDASPDNSAEVATELSRENATVTFVRHATNKGHIATYNEGIEWASADYYMILSADDYLLPGALSRSAKLMDMHPTVGFVYGRAITLDCGGTAVQVTADRIRAGWRLLRGVEFIELSGARNIVPTPTAVVRTELQRYVGGYRPELPHAGDMEMWLRLAAHGAVGVSEAYHAVYRQHNGNMSLHYTEQSLLPDLCQRKAAIDCFFHACSHVLPNAQQLRRRLFWDLGRNAIGFASTAFNEGKMEISEQLSEFALCACPQLKRSLPRIKLACKRGMGRGTWGALQPAVRGVCQVAMPLKRLATMCKGRIGVSGS